MRNYLLLTPGPLSTSQTVREAMLQDWCTWDKDYNGGIVTPIRKGLLAIAGLDENEYTDVLLQGSGTYHRRLRHLRNPNDCGKHQKSNKRDFKRSQRQHAAGKPDRRHLLRQFRYRRSSLHG